MIPFLTSTMWRAGLAVALVLAVMFAGYRVTTWRAAYTALPGVQEALRREEGCLDGSRCHERQRALQAEQDEYNREVADGYARQLEEIRNRPAAPAVRLCRPARGGAVRVPDPAGPADGTAPGGDIPFEASGDIGQRLFDLADDADREALKLKWLQQWNAALSQHPDK
jgi:hypothetical protein